MTEDLSKIGSFALLGDADPVPQSLFLSHPEQANTLALLYEVSREVTSILDREELLRRVAERIKKIVKYDVFSVMLWNEQTQHLESISRCVAAIPFRHACGSRCIKVSPEPPPENGASCASATSQTIRATSAVIPAWKLVPKSSYSSHAGPPHRRSRSGKPRATCLYAGT